MATNADLEEAIAADPDALDGYLVYGDWLQTEGDPRGELIALQAAQRRSPDVASLGHEVIAFVAAHRGELLGETLAAVPPEQLALEWDLGFVRAARVRLEAGRTVDNLLVPLLRHPSFRFLRSLVVDGRRRPEVDDVVSALLAAAGPKTLEELRVGDWDPLAPGREAPELVAAFPRLEQPVDRLWASAMAAVAKQRRIMPKYDPTPFPTLVPHPGVADPAKAGGAPRSGDLDVAIEAPDPTLVLRGLRIELEKKQNIGLLAAMRRAFTPGSLDAFAVALGDQFAAGGERAELRFGFLAIGALGGDESVQWIAGRLPRWSHARALQAAELLTEIASPLAVFELWAFASNPRTPRARASAVQELLGRIAAARALSINALVDRSIPTRATGDVFQRVCAAVLRRLRDDMIDGRRIPRATLEHWTIRHPIAGPIARRAIWGLFAGDDLVATFRMNPAGAFVGADDRPIDVGPRAIGVVHPAEIPAAERERVLDAWRKALAGGGVDPLPEQIDRPVHELAPGERARSEVTRWNGARIDPSRVRGVLQHERGWTGFGKRFDYEDDDLSEVGWWRTFPRGALLARVSLDESETRIRVVDIASEDGQPVRTLADVDPVTLSEVLYDLDTATRVRVGEAPNVEKGTRVRVLRGAAALQRGVVFWIGERNGAMRCGVTVDDGQTVWVDVDDVEPLDEPAPAPAQPAAAPAPAPAPGSALGKGTRVRFQTPRETGTGVVFWLGEGKFGGGLRVGIRDDEGATVWAAASECTPVEDDKTG